MRNTPFSVHYGGFSQEEIPQFLGGNTPAEDKTLSSGVLVESQFCSEFGTTIALLTHDVKKALSQVSPNFRKCSGIVLHDRSRKQTYDDPDEVDAVGLSELWTVSLFRCDTTR